MEMGEEPLTLERVVENNRIVYISSDGRKLKSLAEIRKFCNQMSLIFENSDYDFTPPSSPWVKYGTSNRGRGRPRVSVKNPTTSTGGQNSKLKVKVPSTSAKKGKSQEQNELAADIREIQKAVVGAKRSCRNRRELSDEAEMSLDVVEETAMDSLDPDFPSSAFPISNDAAHQTRTAWGHDSTAGNHRASSSSGRRSGTRRGRQKAKPDSETRLRVKSRASKFPERSEHDSYHSYSRDMQLADLLAEMEEPGAPIKLIEIPEYQPGGNQQSRVDDRRKTSQSRSRFVGAEVDHLDFGLAEDPLDIGGLASFEGAELGVLDVPTQSQTQLHGIRVTGQAPPSDTPSRVFMKLKPPEMKKSAWGRTKGSVQLGEASPPSVHTGGRGRFGVVGSGPAPQPIVPDRPEDFCYLPPDVVSDHCYGKTAPQNGAPPRRVQIQTPGMARTVRIVHSGSDAAPLYHELPPSAFQPELGVYADEEVMSSGLEAYGDLEVELVSGGLGSSVSFIAHSHPPMLGDKLPVNILEGVDDSDLSVDPSPVRIHSPLTSADLRH